MNMEIWGPPGAGGVAAGGAASCAVTVSRVRAIPPASRTRLTITVSFLGVIDEVLRKDFHFSRAGEGVGSKKSEFNLRLGGRFPALRRVPGPVCPQNAPDRDALRLLRQPENGGRRLSGETLPGKPARRLRRLWIPGRSPGSGAR